MTQTTSKTECKTDGKESNERYRSTKTTKHGIMRDHGKSTSLRERAMERESGDGGNSKNGDTMSGMGYSSK